MNDGGSVLGGNQSTSGGTDAPILPNQNPPSNQSTPPSASSTPISTPEPTDLPIDSSFDSLDTPSYSEPSPDDDAYTKEFLESLHSPDSVIEDKSKKPKKGLIITVIFLAAVALIAVSVVAFLFLSNPSSTPSTPVSQTSPPYVANFYSYANDLLYGTDSTAPIGETRDDGEYYYSNKIYNAPGSNQEYFDDIYQKYNTFYQNLASSGTTNSNLYDVATDYKKLLDFIKINPMSEEFSYEYIYNQYFQNGEKVAQNASKTILAKIPKNNDYANQFKKYIQAEFDNSIEYLKALEENDCIVEKSIDSDCAAELDISNSDGDLLNILISQNYTNSQGLINDAYSNLGNKCWEIKSALEEGSQT